MPLQARATREMRFANLAVIDVVFDGRERRGRHHRRDSWARACGRWSSWAVTGIVVRLCMLWSIVRPSFGRPHISREAWPLISTGGSIFGAELLGYAEKNLDNVIIGAQLGPAILGQYTRAYSHLPAAAAADERSARTRRAPGAELPARRRRSLPEVHPQRHPRRSATSRCRPTRRRRASPAR